MRTSGSLPTELRFSDSSSRIAISSSVSLPKIGRTVAFLGQNVDVIGPDAFSISGILLNEGNIDIFSTHGDISIINGSLLGEDTDITLVSQRNMPRISLENINRQWFASNETQKRSFGNIVLRGGSINLIGTDTPGQLKIRGKNLLLENEAQPNIPPFFFGLPVDSPPLEASSRIEFVNNALNYSGNGIDIDVSNLIQLKGGNTVLGGDAAIQTRSDSEANALDINISASSIQLQDAAKIQSVTNASGRSGNIQVRAQDIHLTGGDIDVSAIRSFAVDDLSPGMPTGTLGQVAVQAQSITLSNGGQISATHFGRGNAGSVKVTGVGPNVPLRRLFVRGRTPLNPSDNVVSGIRAESTEGQAGNVVIKAQTIQVEEEGQLVVDSRGAGVGGDLTIVANSLSFNDGGVSVTSEAGQAGNLVVSANDLFLNNADILANTAGNSPDNLSGANIILNISNRFIFENNSLISAEAFGTANGGNILVLGNSSVSVLPRQPQPTEDGNDIIARAPMTVDGESQGGNIIINASTFPRSVFNIVELAQGNDFDGNGKNDLDATGSVPGLIDVDTMTELNQGLIELPQTVIDPDTLIAQNPCSSGTESELILSGKGGLPIGVSQSLRNEQSHVMFVDPAPTDWSSLENTDAPDPSNVSTTVIDTSSKQPAQGWTYTEGKIKLVAYNTQVSTPPRLNQSSGYCSS